MNGDTPWAERIYMVVGLGAAIVLTIGALVLVAQSPSENAGLALGTALCWLAVLAFVLVARITRWPGGIR